MLTELTYERANELFRYEPETGNLIRRITTGGAETGDIAGHVNSRGYNRVSIQKTQYHVHRIVFFLHNKRWPKDQIDHINGIRSDNRIENLRESNNTKNQRNRKRSSTNTSGIAGVSWSKAQDKWQAYISDGKRLHLGFYTIKDDARAARATAEFKLNYSQRL